MYLQSEHSKMGQRKMTNSNGFRKGFLYEGTLPVPCLNAQTTMTKSLCYMKLLVCTFYQPPP